MPGDFYVGYEPKAAPALARRIGRLAMGLIAGGVTLALALAVAQRPFAAARFEYGVVKTFEGEVTAGPYPLLDGRYLLVGEGKHGAEVSVNRRVRLRGSLISRDGHDMIEVVAGSVRALPVEEVTLTGEIVDTKCWLGVMKPGSGKVHRDCAARCISGGAPPAFIARDANGKEAFFLLTGAQDLLPYTGEPARVRGVVSHRDAQLYLRVISLEHAE